LIRDIMDLAVTDQLTVLRTFAFATDAPYALQTSPGVYNEGVFRGLDYALDQARQRGLKVCLLK
jgi:mannan endo-1,4-beta-mannosidase